MTDKSGPQSAAPPSETTFRSFSREQGENYAQHRRNYHPRLYQMLLDYHKSNGGQLDTLLDVGCGPGTAVRTLAPQFAHAIGLDPSEGMLAVARSLGGATATSEPIRFEASTIEDASTTGLSPPLADGSVDLIISATAAHWFDMAVFWRHAARLLKPGGTVALWCSGGIVVDPAMANGPAIQAAIDGFELALDDYILPGNRLARTLYAGLQLPWTLDNPVPEFDRDSFVRREWGTAAGAEPIDEFYAGMDKPAPAGVLAMVLATTSPYVRWREAHPAEVDTDSDPLQVMKKKINALVEGQGADGGPLLVRGGVAAVLLMVKKKSE
ncbi:uncharacterized protein THITE_2120388 [Thermothielavioides terrestris NRRL 8126]|uniref:Methyltransferase type 11 domain-containing protein n=1 Tax=Thermothielavioides terrestris (strain ATCC 38088 / NRRL 8126) TaxID=578455 RepID=G2RAG7_THETT|nr:uncharacterized protein THITE_2120388 [Thermothielavioides terrestris NRRL 8126]AEO69702.1 hypothetical protein THITE_2120388 [Thermothielavioides terrestris NRRL 8126]